MKGKEKEMVVEEGDDEHWHYDLSYVSGLMNASEYRDMEVRAYLGVDVVDPKSRKGIEAFLDAMEFKSVPKVHAPGSKLMNQALTQLYSLWPGLSPPNTSHITSSDHYTAPPRYQLPGPRAD